MVREIEVEIRENFSFFQGAVGELMADHAGEYALLHGRQIVALHLDAGNAVKDGQTRFGPKPFSVQKVMNRPLDLGFLAYAADNGDTIQR